MTYSQQFERYLGDFRQRLDTLVLARGFASLAVAALVVSLVVVVAAIRAGFPDDFMIFGRLFLAASLGGLAFVALRGCIGGPVMDLGFAGYGALMGLAAVQTARHALARRTDAHRAWALRLYALAIGS